MDRDVLVKVNYPTTINVCSHWFEKNQTVEEILRDIEEYIKDVVKDAYSVWTANSLEVAESIYKELQGNKGKN